MQQTAALNWPVKECPVFLAAQGSCASGAAAVVAGFEVDVLGRNVQIACRTQMLAEDWLISRVAALVSMYGHCQTSLMLRGNACPVLLCAAAAAAAAGCRTSALLTLS
jgi:hypothetical protein